MVRFLKTQRKSQPRPEPTHRTTSVSFTTAELADLGQVLAAGQVVLQKRIPIAARLKAAMTRLGVTPPHGL